MTEHLFLKGSDSFNVIQTLTENLSYPMQKNCKMTHLCATDKTIWPSLPIPLNIFCAK